mmetsp:Transcript_8128/g.13087  ORF Transcript_8128/g.13087 Transcript_8128/m.13087 type:complete len:105 (-) Transcript_8128:866-1180(-)
MAGIVLTKSKLNPHAREICTKKLLKTTKNQRPKNKTKNLKYFGHGSFKPKKNASVVLNSTHKAEKSAMHHFPSTRLYMSSHCQKYLVVPANYLSEEIERSNKNH